MYLEYEKLANKIVLELKAIKNIENIHLSIVRSYFESIKPFTWINIKFQ